MHAVGRHLGRRGTSLALLILTCCTNSGPGHRAGAVPQAPSTELVVAAVCAVPSEQLARVRAGHRPGRSGDVLFFPRRPNYFGQHSHAGPWPYLQRVPLFLYGPGHVPGTGDVPRPVSLEDVVPTLADHLDFSFRQGDGEPLPEAVKPDAIPPRLIVVVVWDGGGWVVLREHPTAWPALRRLRSRGAWFTGATVGSSPSVSPPIHATLGTGLAPAEHEVVDTVFRDAGRIVRVQDDPRYLLPRTLADSYDRRRGNRPIVGLVGHPLMQGILGHGSAIPGADRDLSMIESDSGWTPPPGGARYFKFPGYAGDPSTLRSGLRRLDRRDGRADGAWRDESLGEVKASATPAFASFQTQTIAELIRREDMGADRVPDLLLLNFNQINQVGHRWSMNSPQMNDVVRSSDQALHRLVRLLDEEVGRREWILTLTADHGSTPDSSVSGGFVIDAGELARDLRAAFDRDGDAASAIAAVRVTQLWVNRPELDDAGFDVGDVAWFLRTYTQADNRRDPGVVPSDERDTPVFATAFPSVALRGSWRCPEQGGG